MIWCFQRILFNFSEDISDEQKLLRERRFLVCESALLDLIKRSTCVECGQAVNPDSVVEGEKISAGIKYKFVCNVSTCRFLLL